LTQLAFDDSVSPKYQKFNPHVMGFSLTYHVNLKLSTRQTAQAIEGIHDIKISHAADETYIKYCHAC